MSSTTRCVAVTLATLLTVWLILQVGGMAEGWHDAADSPATTCINKGGIWVSDIASQDGLYGGGGHAWGSFYIYVGQPLALHSGECVV